MASFDRGSHKALVSYALCCQVSDTKRNYRELVPSLSTSESLAPSDVTSESLVKFVYQGSDGRKCIYAARLRYVEFVR